LPDLQAAEAQRQQLARVRAAFVAQASSLWNSDHRLESLCYYARRRRTAAAALQKRIEATNPGR
jgi:hypothetical protein